MIRKSIEKPALLTPADLIPLRQVVGSSALDYARVIAAFHFMNRMADLLGVAHEILPDKLRSYKPLRRASIQLMGYFMTRMDLANRSYEISYQQALAKITPVFEAVTGRAPQDEFENLRERTKLIEIIQLMLEERQSSTGLDKTTIIKIQRTVEAALPTGAAQTQGPLEHRDDPVEDFTTIGTRYSHRADSGLIEALRAAGYEDRSILDLALTVAYANDWARVYRLYGLDPNLFYLT